jgi:gamma-glutamyltranspeptidase/glutathione hydrolase
MRYAPGSARALVLLVLAACGGAPAPTATGTAVAPPPPAVADAGAVVTETKAAAPKAEPWPHATPVVVRGEHGVAVSDEGTASKVARDVLASGGNAADAAVALGFALAVTYPTAGNIGGGGFAVTKFAGEVRALDFRETAPGAATHDMFKGADGKATPEAHDGIKSAGVPGSVAGLWELYQKLGSKKKTWAELVAPATALARDGFEVTDAYLEELKAGSPRLQKYPSSMALYFPGGKPPEKGSLFKNPELAAVLKRIEAGPKGFYEGPTAATIAKQMKEEGGLITAADLKNYKAKWRKPVEFTYRGYKVTSMPPPSSGGITLAMMLHIVEGYELGKLGFQSPEALHYEWEAMRRGYAARNTRLGDPDFVKAPYDELLSENWAKEQRSTIKPDRATPSSEIPTSGPASATGPHTTHYSVVDGAGNAVALTTTVNWWFGSGVVVKGAGFVLNNEMDDFASVPGTPNGFGLVQGEANAIAPNKRMLSSMAPTIVTAPDGKVVLVVGGAGGPTITTAVFQEIVNVLDFGLDVGKAVSSPRFHMQHLPDVVMNEKNGLPEALSQSLTAMGYTFKERPWIADAPAIGRAADGSAWIGVAEPRRPGGLAAAPQ